jgi:hypothetical protein
MRITLLTIRLLILAVILGTTLNATAQPGITSEGREFWFGFMPNYITPAQAISVYVGTAGPNKIKLETFGADGGVVSSQSVTLAAEQVYKFKLSIGISETRERETPVYHAIRVTSSSACTVVGYSDNSLTTDGFLAIPTPALGTEHYCFSYYDDAYSAGADHLGGEFLIVAPNDGTRVTITTTANTTLTDDGKTPGHSKGQTWSVDLKRGQTYLVQTTGWNYGVDDPTGSKITSNKPIGFLSGHQRAEIELEDGNSKDHLIEMIPSTEHWGTEYYGIPPVGRPICGSYYRVISAENNNSIKVKDDVKTLQAGEYAEYSQMTDAVQFISTNKKRFLVVEYFYEQAHFGDPGPGDPDMLTLTPITASLNTAVFRTPSNAGAAFKHYARIVAPSNGIHSLTLKKGNSTPVSFTDLGGSVVPIKGTTYSYVRVLLTADEVTWTAHCDVPFSLTLYGATNGESYAYPGPRSFASANDSIAPRYKIKSSDVCGNYLIELTDNKGIFDAFAIQLQDTSVFHSKGFTENYSIELGKNFIAGDSSVTISLTVIDASKPATLALYFVDEGGYDSIFYASYSPKTITWAYEPFPSIIRVGDTVCRTVTYWNRSTDSAFIFPYVRGQQSAFHMPQIDDLKLGPNDSVSLEICFIPKDTLSYTDSIKFITDCYNSGFTVSARGVVDHVYATDRDFGSVASNTQSCKDIEITNNGKLPVVVTGFKRAGDTSFTVTSPVFPFVIEPGATQRVIICFRSRDAGSFSSRIDWLFVSTTTLDKTYSLLTAQTVQLGVEDAQTTQLQIWPNPTSESLNITTDGSVSEVLAVDILGRSYALPLDGNYLQLSASTASLAPGSYTILIKTSDRQVSQRQLVIKR